MQLIEDILKDNILLSNDLLLEVSRYMQQNNQYGYIYCIHNEVYNYYGKDVYKIVYQKM